MIVSRGGSLRVILPSALGSKLMTLTILPDMIERGIADNLDDDSEIEAGDFGAQGHRLRVPASSERPSQRAGSMQGKGNCWSPGLLATHNMRRRMDLAACSLR